MHQIEFKNVTKKYEDEFLALEDVSLSVDKGDFVFIIGHSGAGKSTLIKLLIREELPDAGEIFFEERNIAELNKNELPMFRRNVGVVFQDFKILNSQTVFENVSIALEVNNTPREEIQEVVPNVLHLVGLEKKANTFPSKLSGGEKQRLAIARAVSHEPKVLVADEPTGMIDPKATEDIMTILEKINSLGTTIIMATHNKEIVDKMKKRVIQIKDGKIISDKKEGHYEK